MRIISYKNVLLDVGVVYEKQRRFQNMSVRLLGTPITSQIVAASRRECSRTQVDVARPRCTQYNSWIRTLLGETLGKQVSVNFLREEKMIHVYLVSCLSFYINFLHCNVI